MVKNLITVLLVTILTTLAAFAFPTEDFGLGQCISKSKQIKSTVDTCLVAHIPGYKPIGGFQPPKLSDFPDDQKPIFGRCICTVELWGIVKTLADDCPISQDSVNQQNAASCAAGGIPFDPTNGPSPSTPSI
jgi:hypothetical protein